MQLSIADLHRNYPQPIVLCAKSARHPVLGPEVLHGSHRILAKYFDGGRILVNFCGDHINLTSNGTPNWAFDDEEMGDGDTVEIPLDNRQHTLRIGGDTTRFAESGLRYAVNATQ